MQDSRIGLSDRTKLVSELELKSGSRFRLTRLGIERCPKLRARTGTILGLAQSARAFRVLFDGAKSAQSLHCTYVMPIDLDESP